MAVPLWDGRFTNVSLGLIPELFFFKRVCRDLGVYSTFLHSDSGNAMKALTLIEFLY